MDLFDDLLARPLAIRRIAWLLSPSPQPYGGGSIAITARDALKIGQLMLNGGTWRGRRLLDAGFVRELSSPLYHQKNIENGLL